MQHVSFLADAATRTVGACLAFVDTKTGGHGAVQHVTRRQQRHVEAVARLLAAWASRRRTRAADAVRVAVSPYATPLPRT